jgi:proline dehydrogenase
VGIVLQSYLYRSMKDAERCVELGARVRLCKGAYKEPAEVAFQPKPEVDANFAKMMEVLMARGHYAAIATHDLALIAHAKAFAQAQGIAPDRFEFQTLYGIARDVQERLVRDGYNVRVYVPFGTHWYPYTMRRFAERPANIWFVTRNVLREVGK